MTGKGKMFRSGEDACAAAFLTPASRARRKVTGEDILRPPGWALAKTQHSGLTENMDLILEQDVVSLTDFARQTRQHTRASPLVVRG